MYLCNKCGRTFNSEVEAIKRECPQCNSEDCDHTEIPFEDQCQT